MAMPITPETRTPEQIAADDAFAARASVSVEPELVIRGQRVPSGQIVEAFGMTFDLRPYTLSRRTFQNQRALDDALSDFAEHRKRGVSVEKAWRLCFSTEP